MSRRAGTLRVGLIGALAAAWAATAPATASAATDPAGPICGAGVPSAVAGSACSGIGTTAGGDLLKAGKQLVTGNVGGAVNTAVGGATQAVASTAAAAGFAALAPFVLGGAQAVLNDTAAALGQTTTPQLRSSWFSSTYWRMAAIAAVLTLPFLFAAAVQALIRSDLALLARAALGYLPLAMLAIAIVAPLTTLLLAASDEMCTFISAAADGESAHFLARAGVSIAAVSALSGSPFLAVLVGLFTICAAFVLWIELLMREAAVYVIALMLPLAFAAMVWPARRIWAVRAVELLVALILSKFAIVAVLSLGGAALNESAEDASVAGMMAGAVLITLAAFSPWALLRMVPLAELASGAAGALRGELRTPVSMAEGANANAWDAADWVLSATGDTDGGAVPPRSDGGAEPPGPYRDAEPPRSGGGAVPPGSDGGAEPPRSDGGAVPPGFDGGASQAVIPPDRAPSDPAPSDPAPSDPAAAGDDEVPAPAPVPWNEQPVLELGAENLFATPVWPHEDAS